MSRDWVLYLEDIAESASRIRRYTKGLDFDSFAQNDLTVDAVVRNLEIIGEAAKKLPDAAKAAMPDIEWSKAAGLRDIVAHHYFGLDLEIVWDVVTAKVPEIAAASERLLRRLGGEPE